MPLANKLTLSISLDLDNTWSYLKIRGDSTWKEFPSHFPISFPIILDFLQSHQLKITFFIVGQDAEMQVDRVWFEKLKPSGHDVGNHSFHHEPWMQQQSEGIIFDEINKAHMAIVQASGLVPIGFRGPGFSHSLGMLDAVKKMGYLYDTSLLATTLGPIARLYYRFWAGKYEPAESEKRNVLFGSFSNAFFPNSPFFWKTSHGNLLEVPVTTMPFFRTPIHVSYLIWLSQFSKTAARCYLKMCINFCKMCKLSPSLLLHPPDFLGADDLPALSFFPGMNLTRDYKLTFVGEVIQELKNHFNIITLNEQAEHLQKHPEHLKEHSR